MRNKKLIKIFIIILIVLGIISISIFNYFANADVIENSYSFYQYPEKGDPDLKIIMEKGTITIETWNHAATSNIRWRTIGINISTVEVANSAHTLGRSGPASISTIPRSKIAEEPLDFENAVEKSRDVLQPDGRKYTRFKFSANQVKKALGINLQNIKKDTPIFLHFIFETYNYDTKEIYKSDLQDWKEIMNAKPWPSETLDDFKKYYNIPITFQPEIENNILFYHNESGFPIKDSKNLATKFPGEDVSWDESKNTTIEDYTLIGYKVYINGDKTATIQDQKYLSRVTPLSQICKGSTKVLPGGMKVVLIYKLKEDIKISVTPTPSPPPTEPPEPSVTPIVVPQAEIIQKDIATPQPDGVIGADDRGAEKFTAIQGVPTTESLYTEAGSNQYLMGYDLEKKVGIENYAVRVTRNYHLSWTGLDAEGEPITMYDVVPVTQSVNIRRAYGYWEINNFDYYKIHKADINNYSLPNGLSTMYANSSYYSIPSVVTNHSNNKDEHILKNDEIINGVDLPSKSISGGSSRPSIPKEDFTKEADAIIPDVNVKNDLVLIDGKEIMSDDVIVKEGVHVLGPDLSDIWEKGLDRCNNNVLYKPNQIIEAKKKNGIYHSNGLFTYIRSNSVNSKYMDNIEKEIPDTNSVIIHTPVLCDPIVTEDNDKYVQLINPSKATQVVLDPDSRLNDFTLKISNYGHHSYKMGYFTRDFSRSLRDPENVSYIAEKDGKLRNEVKFPFDVYIKKSPEDKFIKRNTWVIIGRDTETFYVPMWVQEGIYTVSCRTIAVNADMDKLDEISESFVNSKLVNYVATNNFDVEVSGRLYGLSIYDLTDYPMWKEAFRVKNSLKFKINDQNKYPDGTTRTGYSKNYSYNYTVGTNDQYGNDTRRNIKYSFPLVNGSHPFYKNIGILKTGYVVRFKLNTTGTMYGSGCKIRIKPNFYYVDANGNNRTKVDIYYEEEINGENCSMVKMGNKLDLINQKSMEAGSPNVGIPKQEIKDTALVSKMKYTDFLYGRDNLFSFTGINIVSTFRTYINRLYTNIITNSSEYDKVKDTGVTSNVLMKQMQSWYGCYYIPGIMHAVDPADVPNGWTVYQYAARKGVTYHENWWKRNGYIIVNFDVVTVDSQENEHLSYINADNYLQNNNCSMWTFEGAPLSKTDNKGVTFQFKAGDFIIYYVDKSIHSDYRPDGIY